LHDDIGVPWNVLAPKAGDSARPQIVGASRGVSYHHSDGLTFVKISLRVEIRTPHGQKQCREKNSSHRSEFLSLSLLYKTFFSLR
jgi:hypothetical protein